MQRHYVIGGLTVRFSAPKSPEDAADEIIACTQRRSNMYKGVLAMLQKEAEDRTEFETLVRGRLDYWEPLDDDYEDYCGAFTDYML